MKEVEKYKTEDVSSIKDRMVEQTYIVNQTEDDTLILDCQNDLEKDDTMHKDNVQQCIDSEREDKKQGLSHKGKFIAGGLSIGGVISGTAAMIDNAVSKIENAVGALNEQEADKIVNDSQNLVDENTDSSNNEDTDSNVAQGVSDEMSFDQAFRIAREEVGPDGVFEWRGNLYGTCLKSEQKDLGTSDEKQIDENFGQAEDEMEQNDNLTCDLSESEIITSDEQTVEILGIEDVSENTRLELTSEEDGVLVEVEGDVVFASVVDNNIEEIATQEIEIESVEQNIACDFDMNEVENLISQMDFGVDSMDSEEIDYLNGMAENEM